MKKGIAIFKVLISLTLLGCQSRSIVTQLAVTTSPIENSSTISTTLTITSTVKATQVPTLIPSTTPTQTATATITPSVTHIVDYSENCLEVLPEMPLDTQISGQVILTRLSDQTTKIYNFSQKALLPFPNPSYNWSYSFTASPDQKQLAFFRSTMNGNKWTDVRLMIVDITMNILVERPGPLDTWENINWLGNDKIVIGIDFQPVVVDPFTREEFTLSDWYEQSPGNPIIDNISWDTWGVFDSELKTIIYLDNNLALIFWDIENEQILAKFEPPVFYMSFDQPKWSPDETQIVFPFIDKNATDRNKDELYSLDRNGSLTQLTHLNDYFKEAKIWHFSWSPDGRYIAFIFNTEKDVRLGVYDVLSEKVTDYCGLPGKTGNFSEPIWSPDSSSIILERGENDADKTKSTFLLDINQGIAFKIADNLIPEAWIVDRP